MLASLESDIESENIQLKKENETLKRENHKLRTQIQSDKPDSVRRKYDRNNDDIWKEVERKTWNRDVSYFMNLLGTGKLTVLDVNEKSETILIIAARSGIYKIAQLCLNLGADIDHKDLTNRTALDWAVEYTRPHVEQLLLFASMNAAIGSEVNQYSQRINKQNGIINNFIKYLSVKKNKQIVQDTIVDITINIIQSKLAFSDDLLNLAWQFVTNNNKSNPLENNLWKAIKKTAKSIIESKVKNARDWYWFKTYLLPSTIMLIDVSSSNDIDEKEEKETSKIKQPKYLFYELLKMVHAKQESQRNDLVIPMNKLQLESPNEWKELICWDIETSFKNECRQDLVPNGIKSEFTKEELTKKASASTSFNVLKHYDYNEYLSKLVLTANIVDEDFQHSVQKIFNINKDLGSYYDEKMDEKIIYRRGPIKLMSRCKAKAENDYRNEQWPTSSKVVDINRCSLVFTKIDGMLKALKLLQNKIKYYQSGCIIDIVRNKNLFKQFVKRPRYADIKVNVLIRGSHGVNIIGEIQFLLQTMMEFKKRAHGLYSVDRRAELFDGMTKILPNLLNHKQRLRAASCLGEFKDICDLMVTHNYSEKDILQIDKKSQKTILYNVVSYGHARLAKKLKSFLYLTESGKNDFCRLLFYKTAYNWMGIGSCIKGGHSNVTEYLLSIQDVRNIIFSDDYTVCKLLDSAFRASNGPEMVDIIVNKLEITKETLQNKYWNQINYIFAVIKSRDVMLLKRLYSMVDSEKFIQKMFQKKNDRYCYEQMWIDGRDDMLKFMFTQKQLKDAIMNDNNKMINFLQLLIKDYENRKTSWYDLINNKVLNIDEKLWKQYLYYDCKLFYTAMKNGVLDMNKIFVNILLNENDLINFVKKEDDNGNNIFVVAVLNGRYECANYVFQKVENKDDKKYLLKSCQNITKERAQKQLQQWHQFV